MQDFFTGWMTLLTPNQQCNSTKKNKSRNTWSRKNQGDNWLTLVHLQKMAVRMVCVCVCSEKSRRNPLHA